MSMVQEVEQAVSRLSPEDLARFRQWFERFDAKVWDKQFEHDASSGGLDRLADQAIADFHAGKCTEL
jgi:hypothetical protein